MKQKVVFAHDLTPLDLMYLKHFDKKAKIKFSRCRAFLLCKNKATTTIPNAILGSVPCCQRCANKMAKIAGK